MSMSSPIRIGAILVAASLLAGAPALAGGRIEKEFELQPGGRFVLDTDAGSVKVVGSSQAGARVTITSRGEEIESRFDLEFGGGPGQVEITVRKKGNKLFSWLGRGTNLEFEIELPRETDLGIDTAGGSISVEEIDGSVRLDTSGGSISVREVRGAVLADTSGGSIRVEDVEGDVNADTSGGGIDVERVQGELQAETSGGSIRADQVTGNLHADTSGGSIRIAEAGGYVHAETSGGRITVSFAAGNASGGELSTSGGGIGVTLDPGIDLDLDAATSGGSVTLDLPVTVQGEITKRSMRGTVGAGGNLLKLRASGGGIRVEPR